MTSKLNVLGTELEPCCFDPITGFFRDGYCRTDERDVGRHVVCAQLTDKFLNSRGDKAMISLHPGLNLAFRD